jgi:ketosteroid isomerase-like protein
VNAGDGGHDRDRKASLKVSAAASLQPEVGQIPETVPNMGVLTSARPSQTWGAWRPLGRGGRSGGALGRGTIRGLGVYRLCSPPRFKTVSFEHMERRLQALEDAEAIRNLKSRYASLCDDNYDAEGIAALFAEDAIWDSPGLGRFVGRDAIRGFFRGAAGIFSFAIHYSLNGQIYVDGDAARAQWYLFMPCTVADGNRAMWRASIDHERYRRVGGIWLFAEKRSQPLMYVPFAEGWERRRFV